MNYCVNFNLFKTKLSPQNKYLNLINGYDQCIIYFTFIFFTQNYKLQKDI